MELVLRERESVVAENAGILFVIELKRLLRREEELRTDTLLDRVGERALPADDLRKRA